MIWALLPVKSPEKAMERLAAVLSAEQRRTLAGLLYREMLDKLLRAQGFDGVAVVSSDGPTLDTARQSGVTALEENRQQGHSASADWAVTRLETEGARAVVSLPIDVPLAEASEIDCLALACSRVDAPSVVIVPSADGTGTNGLARTPPGIIQSRFGPGSFAAHAEQAHANGARLEVLRPPGLVFDIDTPDDLRMFLQRSPGGPIRDFLVQIGAGDLVARYQRSQSNRGAKTGLVERSGNQTEAAGP